MILLKLLLVPIFIAAVSMAGKRWGPGVAGWLSAFPVVVGTILFFLAIERGAGFAAEAASASLLAMSASLVFMVAYSHVCIRMQWLPSIIIALGFWLAAVCLLSLVPLSVPVTVTVAVLALIIAPGVFTEVSVAPVSRNVSNLEVVIRMASGALLTLIATTLAESLGTSWSGFLAGFPVLLIVLAVFCHRGNGAAFVVSLFRATTKGLYSYLVLCISLAATLPSLGISAAFTISTALSMIVLWITRVRRAPEEGGHTARK